MGFYFLVALVVSWLLNHSSLLCGAGSFLREHVSCMVQTSFNNTLLFLLWLINLGIWVLEACSKLYSFYVENFVDWVIGLDGCSQPMKWLLMIFQHDKLVDEHSKFSWYTIWTYHICASHPKSMKTIVLTNSSSHSIYVLIRFNFS